jgi:hypothetical protein
MSTVFAGLTAPTDVREWARETGLTQTAAKRITGGLSSPGKMPCHSYGLPAAECNVGSQLRGVSGSVCEDCYALKGSYRMYPDVIPAQYRRLATLGDPRWTDAMVTLIGWESRHSRVFRWHDSGDIQGADHLTRIAEVADRLPWVAFWVPTRERATVRAWIADNGPLPANLNVRFSAALKGHFQDPTRESQGYTFSAVALPGQDVPSGVHACPAYKQDGECGSCRACWSPSVPVVAYPLH